MIVRGTYVFPTDLAYKTFSDVDVANMQTFKTNGILGTETWNGISIQTNEGNIYNVYYYRGNEAVLVGSYDYENFWNNSVEYFGRESIMFGAYDVEIPDILEPYFSYASHTDEPPYAIKYSVPEGSTRFPIEYSTQITSLPIPKLFGYTFDGWYYDVGYTRKAYVGDLLYKDTVLYSKFTILNVSTSSEEGVVPFNDYYNCWFVNKGQLAQLYQRLVEGSTIDILSGLEVDNHIASVNHYPFSIDKIYDALHLTSQQRRDAMGIPVDPFWSIPLLDDYSGSIRGYFTNNFKICNITSRHIHDDFRDYEPIMSIMLYLPYKGYVDISPSTFYRSYNWELWITIDFTTGRGEYYLTNNFYKFGFWDVQLGIDVPMVHSDTSKKIRENSATLLTSAAHISSNIKYSNDSINQYRAYLKRARSAKSKSKYIEKIGETLVNRDENISNDISDSVMTITNNLLPTFTGGVSSGGYVQTSMGNVPYLIYEYPETNNVEYSQYGGRPLYNIIHLKDVKGYTEILDIHLEDIPCLEEETNLIYDTLKNGVIF